MNWISSEQKLPEIGQWILISYQCIGYRNYDVIRVYRLSIDDGILWFGSCKVDFWQPIELITELNKQE